jgi:hypothetical protein
MTDRELMQQALEAMEHLHRTGDTQVFDMYAAPEIIPALRERLAQPEQEPVAWISAVTGDVTTQDMSHTVSWVPLTTPPAAQRKPLTLGQKQRLWSSVGDKPTLKDRVNAYGLAIEAAHGIKEKNT